MNLISMEKDSSPFPFDCIRLCEGIGVLNKKTIQWIINMFCMQKIEPTSQWGSDLA